jgi:hypothetical protein
LFERETLSLVRVAKPDDSWQDGVVQGARNPNNWLGQAQRLKRSADLLLKRWLALTPQRLMTQAELMQHPGDDSALVRHVELYEESMACAMSGAMLLAFAIENYLKGILVARDPSMVKPPPHLFDWNHRLGPLADRCAVALEEQERDLLNRLTTFTMWGGRYPAPKVVFDAKPDKSGTGPVSWSSEYLPITQSLIARLDDLLQREISGKQKSAKT